MDIKVIESSETWKRVFNVSANLLLVVAAGGYAWESFSNVGVARLFMLCSLVFLALVLLVTYDGAKGLHYLRSTYLAVALGTVFLFLKFMPNESLVLSVGDFSGSVSFIEPLVIFVVFMGSVALQMSLLRNLENGKGLSYISSAFLGVIGLLIPRMLDSYALVWWCVDKGCQEEGDNFAVLVPMYNVCFSFVITLCLLALVIYFIVPILPKFPNFSQAK